VRVGNDVDKWGVDVETGETTGGTDAVVTSSSIRLLLLGDAKVYMVAVLLVMRSETSVLVVDHDSVKRNKVEPQKQGVERKR
jgi:hypothetical protein